MIVSGSGFSVQGSKVKANLNYSLPALLNYVMFEDLDIKAIAARQP